MVYFLVTNASLIASLNKNNIPSGSCSAKIYFLLSVKNLLSSSLKEFHKKL